MSGRFWRLGRPRAASMLAALALGLFASVAGAVSLDAAVLHRGPLHPDVPFRDCFERAATRYALPPRLLVAVAKVESAFNPRAVSHKNAVGVMQILWPITARHLGILDRESLFDPCLSIDAGSRYLRELFDEFQHYERALAAYNMGPTPVRSAGRDRLPAAGRDYVRLVSRALEQLDRGGTKRSSVGRESLVVFTVPSETRAHETARELRRRRPDATVEVSAVSTGWEIRVSR